MTTELLKMSDQFKFVLSSPKCKAERKILHDEHQARVNALHNEDLLSSSNELTPKSISSSNTSSKKPNTRKGLGERLAQREKEKREMENGGVSGDGVVVHDVIKKSSSKRRSFVLEIGVELVESEDEGDEV